MYATKARFWWHFKAKIFFNSFLGLMAVAFAATCFLIIFLWVVYLIIF